MDTHVLIHTRLANSGIMSVLLPAHTCAGESRADTSIQGLSWFTEPLTQSRACEQPMPDTHRPGMRYICRCWGSGRLVHVGTQTCSQKAQHIRMQKGALLY